MFIFRMTEEDLAFLPPYFGKTEFPGLSTAAASGRKAVKPYRDEAQVLKGWKERRWLVREDGAETWSFREELDFMMRILAEPSGFFICRNAGGGILWGAYFHRDAIVLMDYLKEERQYRLTWVSSIPYAVGSLYNLMSGMFPEKNRFRGGMSGRQALNILCRAEGTEIQDVLCEDGSGRYSFRSGEFGEPEKACTFTDAFNILSFKMTGLHGCPVREIPGKRNVRYRPAC